MPAHATADLAGHTVLGHDTHGKHLLTRFDSGLSLHTHLRMDGSWTVVRRGRTLPRHLLPDVRVLLVTEQGLTAYGLTLPVVELIRTAEEGEVLGHLGPDPLRAEWDAAQAASHWWPRCPAIPTAAAPGGARAASPARLPAGNAVDRRSVRLWTGGPTWPPTELERCPP